MLIIGQQPAISIVYHNICNISHKSVDCRLVYYLCPAAGQSCDHGCSNATMSDARVTLGTGGEEMALVLVEDMSVVATGRVGGEKGLQGPNDLDDGHDE